MGWGGDGEEWGERPHLWCTVGRDAAPMEKMVMKLRFLPWTLKDSEDWWCSVKFSLS